jgi:LysM repeat protein
VNAIVRANDLCSRNRVQVRQRLKIPQRGSSKSSGAATEVAATTLNHKVRRGDRLWRLASHYGTTVDRTLHES